MAAFLVVFAVLAYLVHGASDGASVSVMEGDSVTLHIDLEIHQIYKITWYFNDMRIAQITGNQSKLCTDDECKQRFTDRLRLDERTGDLTITHINTTDSGHYQIKSKGIREKKFIVAVHGVPAAERNDVKRKSVKEGEYVTLDPGVEKNPNDEMVWYFNNTVTITGCTDDQCDERFRDRLKLDYQTGSLTITDTRTTDSGLYTLKITNHKHHCDGRCTVVREMDFYVDVDGSGRSPAFRTLIIVVVILMALIAVGLLYCRYRIYGNDKKRNTKEELLGEDMDA